MSLDCVTDEMSCSIGPGKTTGKKIEGVINILPLGRWWKLVSDAERCVRGVSEVLLQLSMGWSTITRGRRKWAPKSSSGGSALRRAQWMYSRTKLLLLIDKVSVRGSDTHLPLLAQFSNLWIFPLSSRQKSDTNTYRERLPRWSIKIDFRLARMWVYEICDRIQNYII